MFRFVSHKFTNKNDSPGGETERLQVGHVKLLKLNNTCTTDTFDGTDLLCGRFVTVRQLDHQKHVHRLYLA